MSVIIDFVERYGQDARLKEATEAELERALVEAGIDPSLRSTLFAPDHRLLDSLLGAGSILCCMVHPAEEEEEEEEEEGEDEREDDDGEPDDETST